MSKAEFLEKLSEALREYMDDRSAYEHISYYSSYIDNEKKKGYTEEEITEKLGNPRLIAKSIIDNGNYVRGTAYTTYDSGKSEDEREEYDSDRIHFYYNGKNVNPLVAKIIAVLFAVIVISLVCLVIWGISWIVFKLVLPLLLIVIIISLVVYFIKSLKQ